MKFEILKHATKAKKDPTKRMKQVIETVQMIKSISVFFFVRRISVIEKQNE